jgi:DNA-binding CsgD family transcriptional regulator/tetratricopeptide (TPR) repeat protein
VERVPIAIGGPSGLLERASQLAALAKALEAVQASSFGQVVLVSGDAGIGKTVLLQRFCETLSPSVRLLRGSCDPLFAPAPLGPLLAIAEGLQGKLKQIVRSGSAPHDVALALNREFRSLSPSVFIVEDLHWADEATLDVLMLLARRVETVPVLIVASYRDDGLDRAHPLRRLLGELATRSPVLRLKLAPLSPGAVSKLALAHGADARDLYEKTGGNPFFVVEALASGVGEIPPTVRDAVLARVAPLSGPARRILEVVSVIPQRVELWLLDALVSRADGLDECIASGMLVAEAAGVAFRHELARLAVEESVGVTQKVNLHRKVVAALSKPPTTGLDMARLAHHSDAAGDVGAVVLFALPAAEQAASAGAHREAAAQYARVLKFGAVLSLDERAKIWERRSHECYLTDKSDEAIAAIEEALKCYRELGDRRCEGDALRWLSEVLWCPGRTKESEVAALAAISRLEPLPPGPELCKAYAKMATTCGAAARDEEAVVWAKRALETARDLDDTETSLYATAMIAACGSEDGGFESSERTLGRAQRAGSAELTGRIFSSLVGKAIWGRHYEVAARHVDIGVDYCSAQGLELYRLYLLAYRARLELAQGHWSRAAETAAMVLSVPRTSTTPRIMGLVVLGLVKARRGEPGHRSLLDEAWALAEPTGELPRLGFVAAARAEAGWLAGNREAVASATQAALPLALELRAAWFVGELAQWRSRVGLGQGSPRGSCGPYLFQLAGDWEHASALWTEMGCPFEAALALMDSDEEEPLRRSLDTLQRLEARAAVAIVARRLRKRGARSLPRGPRPATRQNQFGLTRREVDVLALVNAGLQNGQIAAQLVVSVRTVDHHVEAILRKLGARTRSDTQAAAKALGLTGPIR